MAIVKFVGFDYMNSGIVAEIKRNVTALLETPEGSCPGDRSYGISQDFIGMPISIARNLAVLSAVEKMEIYEPRATLLKADINAFDGTMESIYLIGPNFEYEEMLKETYEYGNADE